MDKRQRDRWTKRKKTRKDKREKKEKKHEKKKKNMKKRILRGSSGDKTFITIHQNNYLNANIFRALSSCSQHRYDQNVTQILSLDNQI